MRLSLAPTIARAALASLLALSLAAACGDDDDGPSDDADDADDADDTDDDDGPDAGPDVNVSIDGLDGPVEVTFDAQGILHASCVSDADCFAVEGYFHAAHRFAQMDIRRRLARGRLSGLVGSLALAIDGPQRQMMTARDGQPLEERLYDNADAATVSALEAYSRGVNAWMSDARAGVNGAVLPDEYNHERVIGDPLADDWEPLDSVACVLPLVDSLTNDSQTDIRVGQIYGALPEGVATDLFPVRPPSASTVLPPPIKARRGAAKATRAQRRLHERMARSAGLFRAALRGKPEVTLDHSSTGSNNWIVGPDRTSTGGALLANDPHLAMSHPAIWYLVNLDARSNGGTLHVEGASFAGLPGILLGHNGEIAWGATTTYFDATDVYVETLNDDGTAVIFNGEEVPIQQVEYTFEVAQPPAEEGEEPPPPQMQTLSFPFVPHHGPIVETDTDAGTALSVRWTGHDADTDINFFLALESATSVDEARTALRNVTTAGQNFVVADREGNIAWFPYNRLPTRPWASAVVPAWMPVPGNGEFEWGEPVPYEDLPQAVNPAEGYLATANNDMTGSLRDGNPYNDGDAFSQGLTDEGYRHERIIQRLAERDDHDLASMQSIQADVHSIPGELLTPAIIAAIDGAALDDDAQATLDALAAWDFECPTGLAGIEPDAPADPPTAASARGCLAFHVVYGRLRRLTFADELAELAPEENLTARPAALINLMTDPESLTRDYWNDVSTVGLESEQDIVIAALGEAGAYLREELGEDPASWLWGRLHTLTLRADLFSNIGVTEFDSNTYANDGGAFTVDVAHPISEINDNYEQNSGPSMRFACQTGADGVDCTIELPGGQRHDRSSGFYNSMLPDWLTNQPAPFLFDIDEVQQLGGESLQVNPR